MSDYIEFFDKVDALLDGYSPELRTYFYINLVKAKGEELQSVIRDPERLDYFYRSQKDCLRAIELMELSDESKLELTNEIKKLF